MHAITGLSTRCARILHRQCRSSSSSSLLSPTIPAAAIAFGMTGWGMASRYMSTGSQSKNHIHNPIRDAQAFQTALSTSTSSRRPLLTLWTTSYCPTCRHTLPLLKSLIASGVGEAQGGVNFAEIEFDAPDIMAGPDSLPMTYMITSVPTLLSFDGGEAMTSTKVVDGRKLADKKFLEEWIAREAERRGGRGGGGGGGESVFGGLFGGFKS